MSSVEGGQLGMVGSCLICGSGDSEFADMLLKKSLEATNENQW